MKQTRLYEVEGSRVYHEHWLAVSHLDAARRAFDHAVEKGVNPEYMLVSSMALPDDPSNGGLVYVVNDTRTYVRVAAGKTGWRVQRREKARKAQPIERSGGIIPRDGEGRVIPWAGPMPGGGGSGITKALDEAVQRGAQWLQSYFKRPAVIRFNSHRFSGGGWLKDEKYLDAGVGLCCVVRAQKPTEKSRVWWEVVIDAPLLKDPRLANQGNPGRRYLCKRASGEYKARAMLVALVDVKKLEGLAETVQKAGKEPT